MCHFVTMGQALEGMSDGETSSIDYQRLTPLRLPDPTIFRLGPHARRGTISNFDGRYHGIWYGVPVNLLTSSTIVQALWP
jgi:hypothetical protein